MEALWNQVYLQPPPYRSWDVSISEYDPKKFVQTLDVVLNDFKTFDVLHREAALLSRLIYRMKSKFRSDKGLKNMEKVNRALLSYLNLSLHKEFEMLKEYTEISIGTVSLPSKQTLEYLLVKTQGFAKLMCRIESTAMTAATFLQSRLQIGQAWSVATFALAIISRIWFLSRCILKKSCLWYNSIYKFTGIFETVGISWLPENYVLPKNLSKWLDLPWLSENWDRIPLQTNLDQSTFDLIKVNDEVKLDENVIDMLLATEEDSKSKVEEIVILENSLISEKKSKNEDLGESISREIFEETQRKSAMKENKEVEKKKVKKNGKKNEISTFEIKSEQDLIRLLTVDSFPGFDKLQWSILKKKIKKLLLKLTNNNTRDIDAKLCKKVSKHIDKWTKS